MSAPADLAEIRLVRALKSGQPGAFPTLWNAQAGAIWSVIRAVCPNDVEAIGWAITFRVELAERAADLSTSDTVASQVGRALYSHLKAGFPAEAPLPAGPIPPTEAGARLIPEAARLLYLVDLFFDVPLEALEALAGKGARRTLDAVHRLLEPTDDTDARLYIHASLMRTAPLDVLILPPGVEPERPNRWWIAVVLGLVLLGLASIPFVRPWLERPDVAELASRHAAALDDVPLRDQDPAVLAIELSRRGVPSQLAAVPDLSSVGLTLLGARVVPGAEVAVVLTYHEGTRLWTLQHLLVAPEMTGSPVATAGDLRAWSVGAATLVPWSEGGATWVLSSDAPPKVVFAQVERVRESHAAISVPFIGGTVSSPKPEKAD